jgi:cytochrome c oxidase subunit 2
MIELLRYFGLPPNYSVQGVEIDQMIVWVHWLMAILFVGWGTFFIYTLFRYRRSKNPEADYTGVKKHYSKYAEIGVVCFEALLLIGVAFPAWANRVREVPPEEEAVVVRVVAEQFVWNIHYPGADGMFGEADVNLIDPQTNPLGLDRSNAGIDDIVTINQLHLPVNRPIVIHLTSKDVIHSFALPVMRVKQDAIPGMSVPVQFEATETGNWEIACAQICGLGHYRMRGFLTIETGPEFEDWLVEQAADLEEDEGEWWE